MNRKSLGESQNGNGAQHLKGIEVLSRLMNLIRISAVFQFSRIPYPGPLTGLVYTDNINANNLQDHPDRTN